MLQSIRKLFKTLGITKTTGVEKPKVDTGLKHESCFVLDLFPDHKRGTKLPLGEYAGETRKVDTPVIFHCFEFSEITGISKKKIIYMSDNPEDASKRISNTLDRVTVEEKRQHMVGNPDFPQDTSQDYYLHALNYNITSTKKEAASFLISVDHQGNLKYQFFIGEFMTWEVKHPSHAYVNFDIEYFKAGAAHNPPRVSVSPESPVKFTVHNNTLTVIKGDDVYDSLEY